MSFPVLIDMNLSPVWEDWFKSVIQLRSRDLTPDGSGSLILEALASWETELRQGALVTVDETSRGARILPLRVR